MCSMFSTVTSTWANSWLVLSRCIGNASYVSSRTASVGASLLSKQLSREDMTIVNLAKKITSISKHKLNKDKLLSKLSLTDTIVSQFEVVSSESVDSSAYMDALNNLRTFLNNGTLGILEEAFSGSSDARVPTTSIKCCGCGAKLQCSDRSAPGFIPKENMKSSKKVLHHTKCKRCSLLHAYDIALATTIKPGLFKTLVAKSNINSAVLLMVDLTDFSENSSFHLFEGVMHKKTEVIVVGNKFDLIPPDAFDYDDRIKQVLKQASSILERKVRGIHLVSAKTGFGIEQLVSSVQKTWQSKRDIYLIGAANAGKSTLFNALIDSDLCSGQAAELHERATVSKWPGTTLNTLKFPLERTNLAREGSRSFRLFQERMKKPTEEIIVHKADGYVSGSVDRSFVFGLSELRHGSQYRSPFDIDFASADVKSTSSMWFYDTPGIMNDNSVLPLLNKKELVDVIPTEAFKPRIFSLRPSDALSFAGLGKVEYLQGNSEIYLFVFSSHLLPVVIATIEDTNKHFPSWVYSGKLQVPESLERHNQLGSFHSVDIGLESTKKFSAATDVVFSSTGWITVVLKDVYSSANIRASCLHCRPTQRSPLLPDIMKLKGRRHGTTPKHHLRKDFDKIFTVGKEMFKLKRKLGDQRKLLKPRVDAVAEKEFKDLISN